MNIYDPGCFPNITDPGCFPNITDPGCFPNITDHYYNPSTTRPYFENTTYRYKPLLPAKKFPPLTIPDEPKAIHKNGLVMLPMPGADDIRVSVYGRKLVVEYTDTLYEEGCEKKVEVRLDDDYDTTSGSVTYEKGVLMVSFARYAPIFLKVR